MSFETEIRVKAIAVGGEKIAQLGRDIAGMAKDIAEKSRFIKQIDAYKKLSTDVRGS